MQVYLHLGNGRWQIVTTLHTQVMTWEVLPWKLHTLKLCSEKREEEGDGRRCIITTREMSKRRCAAICSRITTPTV